MRAIIMEIKDNKLFVLTEEGSFKEVNKPKYDVQVGMKINVELTRFNFRRIAAILIIVFLVSGFGVSAYAYYTPYGYININSREGIEVIYNRFNRVLDINGIDEKGMDTVSGLSDYKYKKVDTILDEIINENLIDKKGETNILLAFDNLDQKTLEMVKESFADTNVNIYTIEIPKDEYDQEETNVSSGKSTLIEIIINEKNNNYTQEELEQKTIAQLIDILKDERDIDKINQSNNKTGNASNVNKTNGNSNKNANNNNNNANSNNKNNNANNNNKNTNSSNRNINNNTRKDNINDDGPNNNKHNDNNKKTKNNNSKTNNGKHKGQLKNSNRDKNNNR
ncbi:hypothetical protein SH1V18_36960 [Vallitalea longa]|uniref:RsgI N-terminal anti-sigma domain-containing protein n=1 Tax=Vallitalea longa TaxID=2936439 RepID=A0A9W6DFH0_9FIRM|nr:anti-sigma factor domain-containing protein [Vallitalea longa]GKX31216.1 hypothetical protein SH1V18_36960 [Vallitalea longa]